ncbi:MAG: helix-turn-helix domain-containing protein [Rhodobacteraceae bacterium]|nr:helix-turn-helix domain-containing protein [Paracoccaceae bacterium]
MIGRRAKPSAEVEDKPKGFDDFELRLGDLMRGERATLAKSLLDVQRELRIKASYIAAIENADVSAFETPGFVAGYVRSYARYLGMNQDWAFARFCLESGFTPTHGMAAAASGPKPRRPALAEPLADPNASFVPRAEAFWRKIEPRAVGSVLVLATLVVGLGYGGYSILQEVQRVQVAPVEQSPGMLAMIDPLAAAGIAMSAADTAPALPAAEALDRLYRPRPLDTPILVARDSPISAINPREAGVLAEVAAGVAAADPVAEAIAEAVVRTVAADAPAVELLAVRPAWVRVQAADGTVILEKILNAGERFALPKLEEPPVLRAGESGAVYFAVNGTTYGPAGAPGAVTKNIVLSPEALSSAYALADLSRDGDLARMVAVAEASN